MFINTVNQLTTRDRYILSIVTVCCLAFALGQVLLLLVKATYKKLQPYVFPSSQNEKFVYSLLFIYNPASMTPEWLIYRKALF